MSWITVENCPICAAEGNVLFDQCNFKGYQVENRLCETCGCVFQSPRMDDSSLESFYTAEYRQAYQGQEGPTRKDLFVQEKRAQSLVNFLKANLGSTPGISSHLDIGASTGLLLRFSSTAFNLEGIGVEPGDIYRQYARQLDLTMYASLEDLENASQNKYDLISMIHVLEHLPYPAAYLQQITRDYLAEDGYILIEVPNLYAHDSFEVAHLVSYSPHMLTQVLSAAGLEVITLQVHGAPRSKLLPLYITVLARRSQPVPMNSIQPEKYVVLKRRLGMLYRKTWERLLPGQAWLPLPKD